MQAFIAATLVGGNVFINLHFTRCKPIEVNAAFSEGDLAKKGSSTQHKNIKQSKYGNLKRWGFLKREGTISYLELENISEQTGLRN